MEAEEVLWGEPYFDPSCKPYAFLQKFSGSVDARGYRMAGGSIGGSSRILGGCGVGGLWGFGGVYSQLDQFADKAEFIAAIYRNQHGAGNVLYCITNRQLSNNAHLALVEIGSSEIANFPNLCHTPSQMHLFLVNVHNAVNKFCDVNGEPYKEPPKEVIPYEFVPSGTVQYSIKRNKK